MTYPVGVIVPGSMSSSISQSDRLKSDRLENPPPSEFEIQPFGSVCFRFSRPGFGPSSGTQRSTQAMQT